MAELFYYSLTRSEGHILVQTNGKLHLEEQKKETIANYVNFIYANKNKKKLFYKTEQKKTKSNKRFLNIEIKYTFWIKKGIDKNEISHWYGFISAHYLNILPTNSQN